MPGLLGDLGRPIVGHPGGELPPPAPHRRRQEAARQGVIIRTRGEECWRVDSFAQANAPRPSRERTQP
jgi:hypothetical protein